MANKRVLIVFSSGYGSTAEVAQVMAEELRSINFQVDVQSADVARPPNSNEAVIIGSTIRYDRWLSDARTYLNRHQEALAKVPVAYFYNCLAIAGDPTPPDSKQVYDAKLLAMNPRVKPVMVGGFAGALNYQVMPWYFRLILGAIAKSKGLKGGDYRDWKLIKAWINQFANKLG